MATISGHAKNYGTGGVLSLDSGSLTLSGSNLVVYMGTMNGGADTPSAVKWQGSGGAALTLQGAYNAIDSTFGGGSFIRAGLYLKTGPAAATDVGNVTWPSGQDEALIVVAGFSGVDQVTPNTTIVTNSGHTTGPSAATLSVSLTGLTNGATAVDLMVLCKYNQNAYALVKDASQTLIDKVDGADPGYEAIGMSYATVSGTTKTMQWTITATGGDTETWWTGWAFQLNDAGGGGGGTVVPPLAYNHFRHRRAA